MREWFEDVLLHGFAYGITGKVFAGKKVIVSFTAGAPLDKYKYGEMQNFEISEFLPAFIQLTNLCNMKWCGYVISGGYTFMPDDNEVEELTNKHSEDLIGKIRGVI